MQDSELSIKNLQAKIEEAFSDVEQPSSDNITNHNCPECRAVRRVFRNQSWRAIEPKKVYWAFGQLSLFTPEAFHYFLPAFMIYSLREPNSDVCQFVVFALTLHRKQVRSEWWQKRIDKFTEEQKLACNLFLRWLLPNPEYAFDADDIKQALETSWKIKA